jgi:hypothetical protein
MPIGVGTGGAGGGGIQWAYLAFALMLIAILWDHSPKLAAIALFLIVFGILKTASNNRLI